MSRRVKRVLGMGDMHLWAALSADYNPVHLDREYMRDSSYGHPIVYGPLVLAIVSEVLEAEVGQRWTRGGSLEVKFVGPILVDSALEVTLGEAGGEVSIESTTEGTAPLVLALRLSDESP